MDTDEQILNAKILIVDDHAPNVVLLEHILKAAGYRNLVSTVDPRRVEGLYREAGFDLVLLDLNMPHMDGFDVMARLREIEQDSYTPVLVLTAQGDAASRIRALQSGAKDFLPKPIDRLEVLTRIRNLLEVRLSYNRVRDHNKLLDGLVAHRTQELWETRLQVIRRLGRAAEYKDNETGFHIIRMSQTSALLAQALGMSDAECGLLLNASPMHDIGKIGIPDRVLLKPGKLDADEWVIMKSHATIGADLLGGDDSALFTMAREIALTHHEKWDGSGYPNGLKGEDIPISGRIVAVADVFDALTSVRPYKPAWSIDASVQYLQENCDKHFDRRLVERFIGVLPKALEIRDHYQEPAEGDSLAVVSS